MRPNNSIQRTALRLPLMLSVTVTSTTVPLSAIFLESAGALLQTRSA